MDTLEESIGKLLRLLLPRPPAGSLAYSFDRARLLGTRGGDVIEARRSISEDLRAYKPFREVVDQLRNKNASYYDATSELEWLVASVIDLVLNATRPTPASNPDPKCLASTTEELLRQLTTTLLAPSWDFVAIAPLSGLVIDAPMQVNGAHSFEIRMLSNDEIRTIFEPLPLVAPQLSASDIKVIKETPCVVIPVSIPKPLNSLAPLPRKQLDSLKAVVDSIVESMSLLRGGDVVSNVLFVKPLSPLWPQRVFVEGHFVVRAKDETRHYDLRLGDRDELVKMIATVAEIKGNKKLRYLHVGLRFFASSRARPELDDRLIDLVTAFEAIFGEDFGEITFKLSVRVPAFISQIDKRYEQATFIRGIYNKRSRILHGSEQEMPLTLDRDIRPLEDMFRSTTSKIIQGHLDKSKEKLLASIDEMLLSPSAAA
jgi:hypothetical protein